MTESENGRGSPARDEKPVFWMKQDFETAYAYEAFCKFRDMGLRRRLRQVARVFYDVAADEEPSESQVTQVKRWSRQNMGKERAERYDAEQDLLIAQELAEHRRVLAVDHWRAGKIALQAVVQKLRLWQNDPDAMPPSQVASLLREASQLMRLALAAPTSIEERRGDPEAKPPTLDLSGLSDAEVDTLYELMEKAQGSAEANPRARGDT